MSNCYLCEKGYEKQGAWHINVKAEDFFPEGAEIPERLKNSTNNVLCLNHLHLEIPAPPEADND